MYFGLVKTSMKGNNNIKYMHTLGRTHIFRKFSYLSMKTPQYAIFKYNILHIL